MGKKFSVIDTFLITFKTVKYFNFIIILTYKLRLTPNELLLLASSILVKASATLNVSKYF